MKISIITAAYNHGKYIEDCVRSVQLQKLEPYNGQIEVEHIVYNDASTDNIDEIMCRFSFPNLKYITSKQNLGPAVARNEAIKRSTGDWLYILDSDDIMLQRTISVFWENVLKFPNTKWFTSNLLNVNEKLEYLFGEDFFGWQFENVADEISAILRGKHVIMQNVFFPRWLFDLVGGYNNKLRITEDVDLFFRFLCHGYLNKHIPFTAYLRRCHNLNISRGITRDYGKSNSKRLYDENIHHMNSLGIVIKEEEFK